MNNIVKCDFCGEIIPEETLKKRHGRNFQKHYCNRQHDMADRRQKGFFFRLAQIGNDALKKRDLYREPDRVAKIARSNREKPRRKKSK